MTPAEYVEEIVLPTVREFAEDLNSQRRAYLACVACLRIEDHLRRAGEDDVESRIRFAAGRAFEVVRGICEDNTPFATARPAAHRYAPPGLMDGAVAFVSSEDSGSAKRPDLLACLRELLTAYRTEYGSLLGRFDLTAARPGRSTPLYLQR